MQRPLPSRGKPVTEGLLGIHINLLLTIPEIVFPSGRCLVRQHPVWQAMPIIKRKLCSAGVTDPRGMCALTRQDRPRRLLAGRRFLGFGPSP
jgi:hypothetical protein